MYYHVLLLIRCIIFIMFILFLLIKIFPQKTWSQARSMRLFDREFYLLIVITYVNNISIM